MTEYEITELRDEIELGVIDSVGSDVIKALLGHIEKLEAVKDASAAIFKVTSKAFSRLSPVECPHGVIPSYPTHAWWCDKCWESLEDALSALKGEDD